jgi:hypothetical protein
MNEQDADYLEKLYGGLMAVGFLMNGDFTIEEIPSLSKGLAKALAKAMLEDETESDDGIATIKKRKYVRKN